jgi:hypothetical protein
MGRKAQVKVAQVKAPEVKVDEVKAERQQMAEAFAAPMFVNVPPIEIIEPAKTDRMAAEEVLRERLAGMRRQFRQGLASFDTNGLTFGNYPAAKLRLNVALKAVMDAASQVRTAKAVLADLQATLVTDGGGKTGADAILGEELGLYVELIDEAAETLAHLRGEVGIF